MISAAAKNAQRNRSTLFVEDGETLSMEAFPGEQFIHRIIAPQCAAAAAPGSFVHIRCDDTLPMRRPLSIMRACDDWIEILYKIVGPGTRLLSQQNSGDPVSVLGPIGRPFNPDPERPKALLIGGGVGIPPIVFLADVLRNDNRYSPHAVLGSEIPFPFPLETSKLDFNGVANEIISTMPLLESWGVPARLTSLAGYPGCYDGYVTDLAEQWLSTLNMAELNRTKIFSCGPTPMLKAVAGLAKAFDVPCEVLLEEFMACAVGGCAGCAVLVETAEGKAMRRVCVDGPVFDAASVVWGS